MPEVRVQLSDEQAERLRARSAWSRASVADDVLDACTAAVREQLPPPVKVGDKVKLALDTHRVGWHMDVLYVAEDGHGVAHALVLQDGALLRLMRVAQLVRVEEGE